MSAFSEDGSDRTVITNIAAVGDDDALSSIAVEVPLVLVEDHLEVLRWYPGLMNRQLAKHFAWFSSISGVHMQIFPIQLVLPPATKLRSNRFDLEKIEADCVRVQLTVPHYG
ncbi:MAG: hypothetical protein MI861_20190 [Pirellulales bacterium]|nr:hypothetical protein [Pirellulales bacterium]